MIRWEPEMETTEYKWREIRTKQEVLVYRHFYVKMEVKKTPCKFGAKCYRKAPKHFEIYSHPKPSDSGSDVRRTRSKTSYEHGNVIKKGFLKAKEKDSSSESKVESSNKIKTKKKISEKFQEKDVLHGNRNISETTLLDVTKEAVSRTRGCSHLESKPVEEIIKALFLVSMPPDFYSFYEFYKNVIQTHHSEAWQIAKLKLVGPFDVLSGNINYSVEQDLFLCHWRFFYDPPEFQTVLTTDSEFHIGYWRDNPKENPVFLATNDSSKGCVFKIDAENIFGSVFNYLTELIRVCDPFKKLKITKLQSVLKEWANKSKFSLERKTEKMNERQKKVVSKTFHSVGIVVPVDKKTELGYRPLIETDGNLKRICNVIMEASDDTKKESLWENLQRLITAANIANDECDFGNSLELGIDLFCMGSSVFHETVKHLLCTAYSLLDRSEFEKIIEVHLKFRRKGTDLSICS